MDSSEVTGDAPNFDSAVNKTDNIFLSPNGTIWVEVTNHNEVGTGRMPSQNVLRSSPGPTSYAKRKVIEGSIISVFTLFIDDFMIREIVSCTETDARSKLKNDTWSTSKEEIYALLGIFFARGLIAKRQRINDLWSKVWGPSFFRQTMSRDPCKELLKFIRFDVRSSRIQRVQSERFALISNIWNRFIENCILYYRPGANITVDKQLFPIKSMCPFTQYMANKPDKFGIKFWLAVNAESHYLVNGFLYLGKDAQRPKNQSVSEYVVTKLAEPFLNEGRNITCDNFFASVALAKSLKSKKTSIMGTVNKIRRELPKAIKTIKLPLYSTRMFKNEELTLTVYQGKPSKNVLVLSSVHRSIAISDTPKKLPESVPYYNKAKSGVGNIDQVARLYTRRGGIYIYITKVASR